jgi:hypothetical protein
MDGNGFGRWQQRGGGVGSQLVVGIGRQHWAVVKDAVQHWAVLASKRTCDNGIGVSIIEA